MQLPQHLLCPWIYRMHAYTETSFLLSWVLGGRGNAVNHSTISSSPISFWLLPLVISHVKRTAAGCFISMQWKTLSSNSSKHSHKCTSLPERSFRFRIHFRRYNWSEWWSVNSGRKAGAEKRPYHYQTLAICGIVNELAVVEEGDQ